MRRNINIFKYCVISAIITIIIHIDNIAVLLSGMDLPYSKENVMQYFYFSAESIKDSEMKIIFLNLLHFYIIPLFLSGSISGDLNGSGVYVITRQKSRRDWFIKRSFAVIIISAFEALVISLTTCLLTYSFVGETQIKDILLYFCNHFICIWHILIILTVLINVSEVIFNRLTAMFIYTFFFSCCTIMSYKVLPDGDNWFYCAINPLYNYFKSLENIRISCWLLPIILSAILLIIFYIVIQKRSILCDNKSS